MNHLLLIDASGFAHRAYHAGAKRFRSDGLPTWGIEGFMGLMWRLLGAAQHDEPTHAVAVFDPPGKTFRHEIFPAYKTNRPARDMELKAQLPYMRHAAEAMGIFPLECAGFEADDVIATLATQATALGWRTTVVSSDKDFQQLVAKGSVSIIDPVAHQRIEEADVRRGRFGVLPWQVPDVQALCGDDVDNIPGIDGIGAKSAAALVWRFKTVEGVVDGARDPAYAFHIAPGQRAALKKPDALERLKLYRFLATLRRDVPVEVMDVPALKPILREHVQKLLKVLEASGRFESIFAAEPKLQRVVERESLPYEWWEEELAYPGQVLWDNPQSGYYERRLVKRGPFVPVRIWREVDVDPVTGEHTGMDVLRCTVGDEARDAVQEWPRVAGHPITKQKYDFEMADRAWTQKHAPTDPKAYPMKPIDILAQPAPHCPKPVSQKRKKV